MRVSGEDVRVKYGVALLKVLTCDRKAKVPLACFLKNNFFQKTFGGIIEKVYLCTQSIINKEITL